MRESPGRSQRAERTAISSLGTMAAWIVCALCALIIIKPQEFIPALAGLPLLYLAFLVATVLVVLDACWRRVRLALSPQLPFAIAFFAWALLTTAIKAPHALAERVFFFITALGVLVAVGLGCASSRGLRAFAVTFLACGALVTAVALAQGSGPLVCMTAAPDDWMGRGDLAPDGRACATDADCYQNAPAGRSIYRCERQGPLGTSTVRGRVRYRGSLADPNELALMVGMTIPFAFALADRGRRRPAAPMPRPRPRPTPGVPLLLSDRALSRAGAALRALPVVAMVIAIAVLIVLTRSRTGVIVFLVVLGLYFVKRSGPWGLVIGCLAGPPMLLFGGRSGSDAEESSEERLELLREGLEMIRSTKGLGVGVGQFGDASSTGLTAHNAYLLAAAELGLVGACLFALTLYAAAKVPLAIWLGDYQVDATVRRFAPAVFVSLCGAYAGIFFLSWSYKDVLYMALGASAALYGAARGQDERVSVRLSRAEILVVCAGMVGLLGALYVGVRVFG